MYKYTPTSVLFKGETPDRIQGNIQGQVLGHGTVLITKGGPFVILEPGSLSQVGFSPDMSNQPLEELTKGLAVNIVERGLIMPMI